MLSGSLDYMYVRLNGDTFRTEMFDQGAVNLEFVLNYIKGSISCTATPFNESSVIIIWHQLAKSADNLLVWFPF